MVFGNHHLRWAETDRSGGGRQSSASGNGLQWHGYHCYYQHDSCDNRLCTRGKWQAFSRWSVGANAVCLRGRYAGAVNPDFVGAMAVPDCDGDVLHLPQIHGAADARAGLRSAGRAVRDVFLSGLCVARHVLAQQLRHTDEPRVCEYANAGSGVGIQLGVYWNPGHCTTVIRTSNLRSKANSPVVVGGAVCLRCGASIGVSRGVVPQRRAYSYYS